MKTARHRPAAEDDDALRTARICKESAENKKGYDTAILDMRGLSSVADYYVICSGDVQPQLKAIVDEIERTLRERAGRHALGKDGLRGSNWLVLDYGDVVVHVFHHATRLHYGLEELWSDAPRVE